MRRPSLSTGGGPRALTWRNPETGVWWSQWGELELKVRQYDTLLHAPPALEAAPNVNALWARLMVEELCRSGVTTFAIAPGARRSMRSGFRV